jgi:hypothetical protein
VTPFLANLLVGGILALIGWAIAFGIYVVKQDRSREREINDLKLKIAGLEGRFVTQEAWNAFNTRFEDWKEKIMDKLGHLGELIAASSNK